MDSNLQKEFTLRDLPVIYRRRRKVILGAVAALTLVGAIYCIVARREYEASSTIQLQGQNIDRLGLENITGAPAGSSENYPGAVAEDVQTQANILQSSTLALKTIEDLHMEGTKDFEPHWNPVSWAMGLLSPSGTADPPNASLQDAPKRMRHALLVFSRNLSVTPTFGTRLIEITYRNSDPKLAAAVVNELARSLIDFSFQTRFDATNQAANWLRGQLSDLRQQSEEMERKVAELEGKSGVYTLAPSDADGRNQAYSDVLTKLQQATAAMSQADQNRILRGAILHAADNGDAEMLSGLAGNSTNGVAVNNTLTLIQNLRGQEATQQAALQQAEAKYGEAYPRLGELRSNIAALQRSIQQEIERLKGRARSDYEDAVRAEAETRSQYDTLKAQADALNNKSIDFAILRQEADQSRSLYEDLLKRFKEAGVLEGLKGSTITVVDPGRVPAVPKTPNVPRIMIAAIGGGFLLGCCLAIAIEMMDTKINTIEEVQRISGGKMIGVMPFFPVKPALASYNGSAPLASLDDPQSPFIEAARAVRTKIFLKGRGEPSKVILVTSSIPGEGKTTLSANLAVLLAQSSKRVLLVDTDLRLGTLHSVLNLSPAPGLSELLAGQLPQPDINHVETQSNLDVLQAGTPPANPSELLGSSSFAHWLTEWREEYDYVVLDSAPLLPVTDSLTLAPLSDITLLVVRSGLTERSELAASYQLLASSSKHVVATVLNGLKPEEDGYSSYFGYRRSMQKG